MPFEQILVIARLIIFVLWISAVMYMAANPKIPAFNREFSGLIFATACLFYGLITGEMWLLGFGVYMGIRTYQKKINGVKPEQPK